MRYRSAVLRSWMVTILLGAPMALGGCGMLNALQDPPEEDASEEGENGEEEHEGNGEDNGEEDHKNNGEDNGEENGGEEPEPVYCEEDDCPAPRELRTEGDIHSIALEWESMDAPGGYVVFHEGEEVKRVGEDVNSAEVGGLEPPVMEGWGEVAVVFDVDDGDAELEVVISVDKSTFKGEEQNFEVAGLYGDDEVVGERASVEGRTVDEIVDFEVGYEGEDEGVLLSYDGGSELIHSENWSDGTASLGVNYPRVVDQGSTVVVEDGEWLEFEPQGLVMDTTINVEATPVGGDGALGESAAGQDYWDVYGLGLTLEWSKYSDFAEMEELEVTSPLTFMPENLDQAEAVPNEELLGTASLFDVRDKVYARFALDTDHMPDIGTAPEWGETASVEAQRQWPAVFVAGEDGGEKRRPNLDLDDDWGGDSRNYQRVLTDPDGYSYWLEDPMDFTSDDGKNRIQVFDEEGELEWESEPGDERILAIDVTEDGVVVGLVIIDAGPELKFVEWGAGGDPTVVADVSDHYDSNYACINGRVAVDPEGTIYGGCMEGGWYLFRVDESGVRWALHEDLPSELMGFWAPEEDRLMIGADPYEPAVVEWEWAGSGGAEFEIGTGDPAEVKVLNFSTSGAVVAMVQSGRWHVIYAVDSGDQTVLFEADVTDEFSADDDQLFEAMGGVKRVAMDKEGYIYAASEDEIEIYAEDDSGEYVKVYESSTGLELRDMAVMPGVFHAFGDDWGP